MATENSRCGVLAGRTILRWVLGALYTLAGVLHLVTPEPFLRITPLWVPAPEMVVALTGVAEIAGAVGLVQSRWPRLRRYAGIGLALYALCVLPANVRHLAIDMASEDGGLGLAYHLPRLAFQPVLIWLALWTGEATDWPLARHKS